MDKVAERMVTVGAERLGRGLNLHPCQACDRSHWKLEWRNVAAA